MPATLTDREVLDRLQAYLNRMTHSEKSVVPYFKDEQGVIERAKTLELPCYWNMTADEKKGIL